MIMSATAGVMLLSLSLANTPAVAACEGAHAVLGGSRAPCSGLLVPEEGARTALRCIGVDFPTCQADLKLCAADAAASSLAHAGILSACQEHSDLLTKKLDEAMLIEPRPWWDSPSVWFAGGAALGAGLVIAIAEAFATR